MSRHRGAQPLLQNDPDGSRYARSAPVPSPAPVVVASRIGRSAFCSFAANARCSCWNRQSSGAVLDHHEVEHVLASATRRVAVSRGSMQQHQQPQCGTHIVMDGAQSFRLDRHNVFRLGNRLSELILLKEIHRPRSPSGKALDLFPLLIGPRRLGWRRSALVRGGGGRFSTRGLGLVMRFRVDIIGPNPALMRMPGGGAMARLRDSACRDSGCGAPSRPDKAAGGLVVAARRSGPRKPRPYDRLQTYW